MLAIIFWLLIVLCALGAFMPPDRYPFAVRLSNGVAIFLLAILGYKVLPVPL